MLPPLVVERLAPQSRVLVAGAGGGYDVLCALPLFLALEKAGHTVHLASLTSTPLSDSKNTPHHTETLYEVTASSEREGYFPEGWLSCWFAERHCRNVTVWSLVASGVIPLHAGYAFLAKHLELDAIVLVDGGVDSLLRGDEFSLGTPLWDTLNLAAVYCLEEVATKVLAACAFGAERYDGIRHAQALERLADLTRENALLGVSTLLRQTPEGTAFWDASEYVFAHQEGVQQSVVVAALRATLDGHFGERPVSATTDATPLWLSPLLPLYWFCDLNTVAREKQYLRSLLATQTVSEATDRFATFLAKRTVRPGSCIPI